MTTHVSYDGYLQRVVQTVNSTNALPAGSEFIARGRLVNPKGSYVKAPYVALYKTPNGFMAVH